VISVVVVEAASERLFPQLPSFQPHRRVHVVTFDDADHHDRDARRFRRNVLVSLCGTRRTARRRDLA
jgi:hypothetical protein